MKVAHIVDRTDAVGGVQTYLRRLLPGLEARGVAAELIAAEDVPGLGADGGSIDRHARTALDAALSAVAPDAVIVHTAPSPAVARAAAAVAPTLVFVHDYFLVCPGNARYLHRSARFCSEGPGPRCFWRAYTERCTNRRPDRLVRADSRVRAWRDAASSVQGFLVASPFVSSVLTRDGIPADRVSVVAYPVSAPPEGPAERAGDVLYLGRVVASKGVDVLLRAVAGLGATLTVAGDGPERLRLEELAHELGMDVRFLGWVDETRSGSLLRGARLLALPSLWPEAFGIVGVEALAAGTPVVASAVGGIPSWLEEGRGGLLVPPGDVDALRRAILRVLAEPGLAESLGAAGPEAASRFSLDAHLDALVGELDRLVG